MYHALQEMVLKVLVLRLMVLLRVPGKHHFSQSRVCSC